MCSLGTRWHMRDEAVKMCLGLWPNHIARVRGVGEMQLYSSFSILLHRLEGKISDATKKPRFRQQYVWLLLFHSLHQTSKLLADGENVGAHVIGLWVTSHPQTYLYG